MNREIARYVSQCDVCCRVKAVHHRPPGLLQPLQIPEWKWDKIEMDFVTGFPKSKKGNGAIFVAIDRLSKVAHFFPVKEIVSASQLAELYMTRQEAQIVEVSSLLDFGIAFRKPWVPNFCSAPLTIHRQVDRLKG